MAKTTTTSGRLHTVSCQQGRTILLSICLGMSAGLVQAQTNAAAALAQISSVSLAVSPLILRGEPAGRNILVVRVDSSGLPNTTVRVTSPAWPSPIVNAAGDLGGGNQMVEIEVPAFATALEAKVRVESGAEGKDFGPFKLEPPRKWSVYLTQHTHTDIGYTRPQTEILPEHLRYIDYALDFCDLTDHYPDDARFRWTCETAWAVREYLKDRPAKQVERLKRRVAEGRIEICGMMLNMSEISAESSLAALLRPLQTIKNEFGLAVPTAMQDDVNGAGWCLVDYFGDAGIRYLTMGINKTRSILPFDRPTTFWWESPSGKRVLAYRADHYHLGNMWKIHEGKIEKFRPYLVKYLASLVERKYPFDRISVQFSGYHTDNSPPATIECDLVKAWNEQYAWPKLRLSTSHEFPEYVAKEHGAELEVHRQAWPDWWTDGFGSAARETAASRETESGMQVNYGLLTMATLLGARVSSPTLQRAAAVQDDLLFYQEHTFGAAESIDDPLAENTQVQWGEKQSYAWKAVMNSHLLREEAMGVLQEFLPRAEVPTVAICNTLNWPRSGLVRVFIDHQILPPDREARILDGTEPVLAQPMERRSEGTYWALWVRDVPSLGYKMLRIEPSDQPRVNPPEGSGTEILENRYYKLVMDAAKGGVRSLVDKETGQELVDPESPWSLGQCVYETMPSRRDMKPEVFKRTTVRDVKVAPGANGPIWKSVKVTAGLDGCATNNGVRAEIRLYETEKRLELWFALRKLPVRSPESVYVTLPFRMPDSKILYEAQGGLVTPGEDQLPGSASDWQTLQSFIAVRGPGAQIVSGSDQVPLVQLGDFNLGKWQPVTRVAKPHIYSWILNNYWFTNFRAEQDGELHWHYYLTSSTDVSRTFSTRFGWGSRVPLATRVLPPSRSAGKSDRTQLSTLSAKVPNVLVVESRPLRQGDGVLLQLRELEGKETRISQEDLAAVGEITGADQVNVLEDVIKEGIESVTLKPYEVKFIALRLGGR